MKALSRLLSSEDVCVIFWTFILIVAPRLAESRSRPIGDTQCAKFGDRARYNETLQKCVLGPAAPFEEFWSSEKYQCGSGEGGICTWKGCTCRPEFFATYVAVDGYSLGDLACTRRATVGESCADRYDMCERYLTCVDDSKICECHGVWNETDRICYNSEYCQRRDEHLRRIYSGLIYEKSTGQCKCRLGIPCPDHERAPEPASCPVNSSLQLRERVGGDEGTKCVCDEELLPANLDSICISPPEPRQYGEPCDATILFNSPRQCVPLGSGCIDGKCQCYPSDRWDPTLGRCVAKVGSWCTGIGASGLDENVCTTNAICGARTRKRCECPSELHAFPDGQCGQSYGEECSARDENGSKCVQGMECVNGHCGCRDLTSQFYEPTRGQCLTLIDATCNHFSVCADAEHSYCDPTTGKCECDRDAGFAVVATRARCTPSLPYGAECTGNQCDSSKGLTCVGVEFDSGTSKEVCECADSSLVYNSNEGACLAPVGAYCGEYVLDGSCLPEVRGQPPSCEYLVVRCEIEVKCTNRATEFGGDGRLKSCKGNSTAIDSGSKRQIA